MSRRFLTALSAIGRRVVRTKRCKSYTPVMGQQGYWVLEVDIRKYFRQHPVRGAPETVLREESPMVWSES